MAVLVGWLGQEMGLGQSLGSAVPEAVELLFVVKGNRPIKQWICETLYCENCFKEELSKIRWDREGRVWDCCFREVKRDDKCADRRSSNYNDHDVSDV